MNGSYGNSSRWCAAVVLMTAVLAAAVGGVPVAVAGHITGITATASSEHSSGLRGPGNLVNDSGMDANDEHSNVPTDMWLGVDYGANPRGGTVTGSHWVQFDLGQVYPVTEMVIWNYNEAGYPQMGMNQVTIEYSLTGSTDPGDWTVVYEGQIPVASAGGQGPSPADLTVDFGGAAVRYVVITGDNWPGHNYAPDTYGEAGLSEVRFFTYPETCAEAIVRGYGYATDLNGDCYVNLADFALLAQAWLQCIDPTDDTCLHPWQD